MAKKEVTTTVTINGIPLEMHNVIRTEQLKRKKKGEKINIAKLYLEFAVKGLISDKLIKHNEKG